MSGFRKKLMEYLEHEETRNIEGFQNMNRRKSMQRRIKM